MGKTAPLKINLGLIPNGTTVNVSAKTNPTYAPIPQATIDRVLEATDIVELIGSFIALKKLGQSFRVFVRFTKISPHR